MKIYKVGGCVRDKILKKTPHDVDYVVVGATVDEMLAKGFKQVGKNFPVFIDKEGDIEEEYALARKEIRTGNKHTDFEFVFTPEITLKEDLERRDFTCNAIAMDEDGEYIDYFHGVQDIKNKQLNVVNPLHFIEDPLRILRGCRFATQLQFKISEGTMNLFKLMVNKGELNNLSAERIWKETLKALECKHSRIYFENLKECNGLEYWFSELNKLTSTPEKIKYHPSGNSFKHTMICLDRADEIDLDPVEKYAVLCHDLGKGNTPEDILPAHHEHEIRGLDLIDSMSNRLKVPTEYNKFAKLFCKNHMRMGKYLSLSLKKKYDLIAEITDNFRYRDNLLKFLKCFYCDFFGEENIKYYNTEEEYRNIYYDCFEIFDYLETFKQDMLPETWLKTLKKCQGKEYGEFLRMYKLQWLREKLAENQPEYIM